MFFTSTLRSWLRCLSWCSSLSAAASLSSFCSISNWRALLSWLYVPSSVSIWGGRNRASRMKGGAPTYTHTLTAMCLRVKECVMQHRVRVQTHKVMHKQKRHMRALICLHMHMQTTTCLCLHLFVTQYTGSTHILDLCLHPLDFGVHGFNLPLLFFDFIVQDKLELLQLLVLLLQIINPFLLHSQTQIHQSLWHLCVHNDLPPHSNPHSQPSYRATGSCPPYLVLDCVISLLYLFFETVNVILERGNDVIPLLHLLHQPLDLCIQLLYLLVEAAHLRTRREWLDVFLLFSFLSLISPSLSFLPSPSLPLLPSLSLPSPPSPSLPLPSLPLPSPSPSLPLPSLPLFFSPPSSLPPFLP